MVKPAATMDGLEATEGILVAAVLKAAWEMGVVRVLIDAAAAEEPPLTEAAIRRRLVTAPTSSKLTAGRASSSSVGGRIITQGTLTGYMSQILRYLASHRFVVCHAAVDGDEPAYSLAAAEKEGPPPLLQMAPVAALCLTPKLQAVWMAIPELLANGTPPCEVVHGKSLYRLLDDDAELRQVFDAGMVSLSIPPLRCLESAQICDMDPQRSCGTLVDVGGGAGVVAALLTRRYPHITRVINFDLPHVIAAAPSQPCVEHMEGDMFHSIPSADIIFMKHILHNWDDEDCVKILQNCHNALMGCKKLVIMEFVLEDIVNNEVENRFTTQRLAMDVLMMTMFSSHGGKERTKKDWDILLKTTMFGNYKVFALGESPFSIIEATVD